MDLACGMPAGKVAGGDHMSLGGCSCPIAVAKCPNRKHTTAGVMEETELLVVQHPHHSEQVAGKRGLPCILLNQKFTRLSPCSKSGLPGESPPSLQSLFRSRGQQC